MEPGIAESSMHVSVEAIPQDLVVRKHPLDFKQALSWEPGHSFGM